MEITIVYEIINALILATIIFGYPMMAIFDLISLRKRKFPHIATSIWVLIILVVPFLGALAIWIVNPKRNETTEEITSTG